MCQFYSPKAWEWQWNKVKLADRNISEEGTAICCFSFAKSFAYEHVASPPLLTWGRTRCHPCCWSGHSASSITFLRLEFESERGHSCSASRLSLRSWVPATLSPSEWWAASWRQGISLWYWFSGDFLLSWQTGLPCCSNDCETGSYHNEDFFWRSRGSAAGARLPASQF